MTDRPDDTAASAEVPTADALEQQRSWLPAEDADEEPSAAADVPEADAIDQARSAPFDDES